MKTLGWGLGILISSGLFASAGGCVAILGLDRGETDAAQEVSLSGDVAIRDAGADSASPCASGVYDHCFDFSDLSVGGGLTTTQASDGGNTFNLAHFGRAENEFASPPASLSYKSTDAGANASYLDSLRIHHLEAGDEYYVAFSVKVEKFGAASSLCLMSLQFVGLRGDIFFNQLKDGYMLEQRWWVSGDAGKYGTAQTPPYKYPPQSRMDQWHRYEILVTYNPDLSANLRFSIDGDVRGDKAITVPLDPRFEKADPLLQVGVVFDRVDGSGPSDRVIYFDDVVLDVKTRDKKK